MRTFLLGVFILLTSGQPQAQTPVSSGINFFSTKQDSEIGSELSKEAERVLPILHDANINSYVYAIGQRLRHGLPPPALPYRFRIVNSKDVNSVGFPGGAVYIDRGLIETASNDDELAAILAHEMGHIVLRHGTAQLSRQLLVQAPISIAAGLPATEVWKDQLTKLGISFGVDASFLRYSRDQELEANLMAVRLLAAGRFNPMALESLLDNVSGAQGGEGVRVPTFVFNHPHSENLLADLDDEIERLSPAPRRGSHASAEFRTFHAALQRIVYPVVEKDSVEDTPSEAISGVFTHPQEFYRLGYPTGWQVTRTGPNGAIIAPSDGVQSSRAGDDVTHGVMFDLFDISASERALSLEQATNRLIVYLRQNNQSLRVVPGAQTQTLISDEPGLRTVMIGKSNAANSSEIAWVVTRIYYQSLFYMVFVAPEDEFPAYEPIFEQIIRSTRMK